MGNHNNKYITAEEFEILVEFNHLYEGFVEGVGYAFMTAGYIPTLHKQIFNPPRIVPYTESYNTTFFVQQIDTSKEAVELSLKQKGEQAGNKEKTNTNLPASNGGGMKPFKPYAYIDGMVVNSFSLDPEKIGIPIIGYSLNTKKSGIIDVKSSYAGLDLNGLELRGYPFKDGNISGENATVRTLVPVWKWGRKLDNSQISAKLQLYLGVSTG